ncbi:T9SS type A sorting domain-containing protein [Flavobacterium aurantiibacter]|uniref:PKD-like domain-containing protein n=2 Tax=Flavobacterium aurantiibacter TaxID=2023067 RepID=A0A255ZMR0_9FLAO|nr:T9SS type A sorting domain-containing protein [Flavobacterium aurantiibacter]OYQ42803.1 hypothetical protein CHX27_11715 [Flavobacterium aurantiibacter]
MAGKRIIVDDNKYYDSFNNGVWQNPYKTLQTFALTTPIQQSRSKQVYFKLPTELFLSNLKNQIEKIEINANNGNGFIAIPFDTNIRFEFSENKIYDIIYKITLKNKQEWYCQSKFKINDLELDRVQQRGGIVVNSERVYIYENNNFFNAAWLTIKLIPGNKQITKPFIIAEGLDTGNFTKPDDFGGESTLQNFLNSTNNSGNLQPLLDANNNANDYDLIYIDWVRGMADMRANSRVLEEVINWVNAQKVLSGSTEPNVLLGQSMGGVIGRYTLARMERENKTHDVRLFIAHDSPMQGANTPLAFQHFANHMKQEYTETPLAWLTGEVLIPIGMNLAQLGEDFLNFFGGNNNNIPTYVTPSQLLSLQDQTAARQLNYWSAMPDQSQTRTYNQEWQQTLTAMGWPQQSRNIAISNGNECSANNGFVPGAPLLVIDSKSNPGFWLDALNVFLAPFVGVATLDIGLVIVGLLPGNSRWQTNFDFATYGNQGSQNRIYRGRIRYEKKLLFIGPTIVHNLINQSQNAPQQALPFDTYSGGRIDLLDSEGNLTFEVPILSDLVDVVNDKYGFIPVVSALDIKRNEGDVIPSDYLKKYAGNSTPEPGLTSGFDNFIVDYGTGAPSNNQHISFQVRNGNWLAAELNEQPYVNNNCTAYCENNMISGPSNFCTSAQFTVPAGANSYQWQLLQGSSMTSIAGSNTRTVTVTANPGFSGYISLAVVVGNDTDTCGKVTFVKTDIWVGKPRFDYTSYVNPNLYLQHSLLPENACETEGFQVNFLPNNETVTEVEFQKVTENVAWNRDYMTDTSRRVFLYPTCNKNFEFKVRARNSCGWSDWETVTYPITNCTTNCPPPSTNLTGANFVLNPNPLTNGILNVSVKNNAPWFVIPYDPYDPNNPSINPNEGGNGFYLPPFIRVSNISVFSQSGVMLLSWNSRVMPTQLDLSSLPTGTYIVLFTHAGQTESYTIIKN